MTVKIDPILLSVYARTFKAITDEMSISMEQTTRSPILCEAKDFVTGLYDAEGRMLEQTENLPILAFSLAPVCKYIIEYFGDDIHQGDVIFHNDVFSIGNQNNDVAVYKPIFLDGKLVAWTAVKGHQADIGGNVRGRLQPERHRGLAGGAAHPAGQGVRAREAPQGRLGPHLRQHPPRHRAAGHAGRDRRLRGGRAAACTSCSSKYGRESFEAHKEALFDSTEQMMETEIAPSPTASTSGEGYGLLRRQDTRARSTRSASRSPSRTGASPSTTRGPTRRPTAS